MLINLVKMTIVKNADCISQRLPLIFVTEFREVDNLFRRERDRMTKVHLSRATIILSLLILISLHCGGLTDKDIKVIKAGDAAFNDTIKEPK